MAFKRTFKPFASEITFDNRGRGISAPDVQSAIEELANRVSDIPEALEDTLASLEAEVEFLGNQVTELVLSGFEAVIVEEGEDFDGGAA